MGGGMPVGAFTASAEKMDLLSDNPKLVDVVFIAAVVYLLVMVADYHIPNKPAEDEPVMIEDGLLNLLKHKILDAVRGEVNLDESHRKRSARTA